MASRWRCRPSVPEQVRVGIQTWGSMGDIRPMLCLGHALQAAGHQVAISACAVDLVDHAATCRRLGLTYEAIPTEATVSISDLRQQLAQRNVMTQLTVLLDRMFLPALPQMHASAARLARDSDVLIGHFLVHPLRLAAARADLPHLGVAFWPGMVPAPGSPPWPLPQLGGLGNRALWRLTRGILNHVVLPRIRDDWRQAGLPAPRDVYADCWFSPLDNLLACSPLLAPPDPAWRTFQVCGAFQRLPDERQEPIAPELEDFLASGPAPVYLTLGSLQLLDPEGAMALFIGAVTRLGIRAIINTTSAAHPPGSRQGGIFFCGPANHRLLLPRCALVVHHGGAGTSHAVAAAGRPAIVLAFIDEQMAWGGLLRARGIALPPLRYRNCDAAMLARCLHEALADAPMRERARALGSALAQEDGAQRAVELIHAAVARFHAAPVAQDAVTLRGL